MDDLIKDISERLEDAKTHPGKYLRKGFEDTDFNGFIEGLIWMIRRREVHESVSKAPTPNI